MFLVEKIGELILVTLEDHVAQNEIESIKSRLKEIKDSDDEAVVSLNLSNLNGSHLPVKEQAKNGYNEIVEFCNRSNIRIYSYIYDSDPANADPFDYDHKPLN